MVIELLLAAAVSAFLYYFLKYSALLKSLEEKSEPDSLVPELALVDTHEMERFRQYAIAQDIALIQSFQGISYAEDTMGQPVAWTKSIKDSIGILPVTDFFRIRRNRIVRRDIIQCVAYEEITCRMMVTLKPPFDGDFRLSRDGTNAFIAWWQRN